MKEVALEEDDSNTDNKKCFLLSADIIALNHLNMQSWVTMLFTVRRPHHHKRSLTNWPLKGVNRAHPPNHDFPITALLI